MVFRQRPADIITVVSKALTVIGAGYGRERKEAEIMRIIFRLGMTLFLA